MSVKLYLVIGVLYTESGDVVTIVDNETTNNETLMSENMVVSQNVDEQGISTEAAVSFVEKTVCDQTNCAKILEDEDSNKLVEWLEEAGLSEVFPYLKGKFDSYHLTYSSFNIPG